MCRYVCILSTIQVVRLSLLTELLIFLFDSELPYALRYYVTLHNYTNVAWGRL